MTAPYLGGFKIKAIGWLGPQSVIVVFSSSYGSSYLYQLYAGRTLIGVTRGTGDRSIIGSLSPSEWPQHLTLLAVAPENRLTDYGASLPLRPYNKVKLTFSTSSWPSDAKLIELSAGTAVGGAVDTTNVLKRVFYETDGTFTIYSTPMPGTGQWNFEIAGRDDKPPDGNRGTALAVSADVIAHPPDVVLQDDNTRFSVSIASGTATVTFENP